MTATILVFKSLIFASRSFTLQFILGGEGTLKHILIRGGYHHLLGKEGLTM
jgi:hypothetical protein